MADNDKSRADAAMDLYLEQEREARARKQPRLISSQAPGQPKRTHRADAAPELPPEATPPRPPAPPVVERIVHVGPSFWTIVWAVIVAQLLGGFVAAILWALWVQPVLNNDLECATENAERALDGRPEIYCP